MNLVASSRASESCDSDVFKVTREELSCGEILWKTGHRRVISKNLMETGNMQYSIMRLEIRTSQIS